MAVHELIPPLTPAHLETLADPSSTMLVLAEDGLEAEALIEVLADAPPRLNDPWLTLALRGSLRGTLLVRAFTSLDYEACVQAYGNEQHVNKVADNATSALGVERRSLEGVLAFLGR
jgi:hypothetical protein